MGSLLVTTYCNLISANKIIQEISEGDHSFPRDRFYWRESEGTDVRLVRLILTSVCRTTCSVKNEDTYLLSELFSKISSKGNSGEIHTQLLICM